MLYKYHPRSRKCFGVGCLGCSKDWESCSNPACTDREEVTDFSPWVNTTSPEAQGWVEKRFTFQYTRPAGVAKVGTGGGCSEGRGGGRGEFRCGVRARLDKELELKLDLDLEIALGLELLGLS